MKIIYDQISNEYLYPLSKKDANRITEIIDIRCLDQIFKIRFGCNRNTTQEGRVIERGDVYEIRINFCLRGMSSVLLSEKKEYLKQIRFFGGKIDPKRKLVEWDLLSAKRYSYFLLLHEISHIIYCNEMMGGRFEGKKCTRQEEQWCDKMALQLSKSLVSAT